MLTDTSALPRLEIIEHRPTNTRLGLVLFWLIVIGGSVIVAGFLAAETAPTWGTHDPIRSAAECSLIVGMLGTAALSTAPLFASAPELSRLRGRPVRRCENAVLGKGIALVQDRRDVSLPIAVAALGSWLLLSWWAARTGLEGELLYASPEEPGAAMVALVFSVLVFCILPVLVLSSFTKISYEIYPEGILRRSAAPQLWLRDRFLAWEHMAGVEVDGWRTSAYHPDVAVVVIRLADSAAEPTHQIFDRPGKFGIPAYLMKCDVDVLAAVVMHLFDNPETRMMLDRPGAQDWFTSEYHLH